MPVTIKTAHLKYKDTNGEYVGINSIGDKTTAEQLAAINEAGTSKLTEINNAGATQTNAVNSAGSAQLSSVNNAGSTQVTAVNNAGAIQIANIEAKGQETLENIPDEYSELAGDVSSLKSAINELEPRVDSLEINKADVIINTASGAVASFPDGADGMPVKELTVAVEPVQDLHGYDAPWPAGGGKNLFDGDYPNIGSIPKYRAINVGDGTFTMSSDIPLSPNNNAANLFFLAGNVSSGVSTVSNGVYKNQSRTVTAVDGYVTVAYRNLDSTNPADYNVQIESGSSATSFAPYSNVCPITGWTGANVVGAGKNLLPCDFSAYNVYGAYLYRNNVVPKNTEARMTFVDKDTSVDVSGCSLGFVFSDVGTGSTIGTRWCLSNGNIAGYTGNLAPNTSQTFCSNIIIYPNTEEAFNRMFARYNIMVEFGETATSYESPSIQQIPITFPSSAGTVYGGSITVNEDGTGQLVVDRAYGNLNSEITWSGYGSGDSFFVYHVQADMKTGNYLKGICDLFKTRESVSEIISEPYVRFGGGDNVIYFYNVSQLGVSNVDEWKEYIGATGANIVYPLATPITYTMTALEVLETLKGTNNIWADTGAVEVTYRADTKLYIDNRITQAIAAAVAAL